MTLEKGDFITSKKDAMYKIHFTISSKNLKNHPCMSKSRKKIYDMIQKSPGLSRKEIAKEVELAQSKVNHHIRSMVDSNLIQLKKEGKITRIYPKEEVS